MRADGRVYTDYLHDMLEAAQRAEQFITGLSFDDFQSKGAG